MTASTFKYVEDYIEFIAGHRDVSGKTFGMFDTKSSPISLARYDVQIVDSMADQTNWQNKAYTDKQAELAKRLVQKYRRQLSQLNPSVTVPDELDQFRLGIRFVDRSKKLYLENNQLYLKFPYDTKLIDLVKKQIKVGKGKAKFDNDTKVWSLALTEDMINWAITIARANEFDISIDVVKLYNKILEVEQKEYSIQLSRQDDSFIISNAAQSLVDYINENCGGFGLDNLEQLIDHSEVLGYTVDAGLYQELFEQLNDKALGLMITRRKHTFKNESVTLDQILDYARRLNRLPVHVYETGLPRPNTEEIVYLNRNVDANAAPKLLVSKTALMVGTKKQAWITNAEKIFILE